MPRTPKGHKRPADVISNAVQVMKIATGEIEESEVTGDGKNRAAVELGRKGGRARAAALGKTKRKAIAMKAARARWKSKRR
jgi:phage gp16-like protein